MPISNEEAFDMLAIYFECMKNATVASRIYALRYPLRHHYRRKVFTRLADRLRRTGSIKRSFVQRRKRCRTEDNIINVLAYVELNPHVSTRIIAKDLGLTKTTVIRILKEKR